MTTINIDQDLAALAQIVTGLVTLVAVGYTAWQNVRAKMQATQLHDDTIKAINGGVKQIAEPVAKVLEAVAESPKEKP